MAEPVNAPASVPIYQAAGWVFRDLDEVDAVAVTNAPGLVGALLVGDWDVADESLPQHRREGSGLVTAFLQWHLERSVRSLRLVERV